MPDPFSQEPNARLYKTGDLARYLPDAHIEFLGRVDSQVKLRGYRIELGEIETVLRQHEAVQDSVVLVREEQAGEKRLIAYTVVRQNHFLRSAPDRSLAQSLRRELRSYLQERLPAYMIPSAFVPLDALPLTPNGKVDRQALPVPQELHDGSSAALQEARTPIEEMLVGLWREVLDRKQVGIHEHFFEVGGHSLLATRLASRVRTMLRVEMPVRTIFEVPTVAGLAQWVEQA